VSQSEEGRKKNYFSFLHKASTTSATPRTVNRHTENEEKRRKVEWMEKKEERSNVIRMKISVEFLLLPILSLSHSLSRSMWGREFSQFNQANLSTFLI